MAALSDLAKVSKTQGVAAAVALALLGLVGYVVHEQFKVEAQLVQSIDALGDLVISACEPDAAQVQRFEQAKRAK